MKRRKIKQERKDNKNAVDLFGECYVVQVVKKVEYGCLQKQIGG